MWTDVLSRMGLDCVEDDAPCKGLAERCKRKAGRYLGQEWDTCPLRDAMGDPYVQHVAQLEASSKINPLQGWPDDYAAWVQPLWQQLRALIDDRKAHAMEQARAKHGG